MKSNPECLALFHPHDGFELNHESFRPVFDEIKRAYNVRGGGCDTVRVTDDERASDLKDPDEGCSCSLQ